MLNRQKGYTSQKTIFCHFTLQNITMRKYFHLFSITSDNKITWINLHLINRLNHSSLINDTVTNKIRQFPQLFALGPQILLKLKRHQYFFP